MRYHLSTNLPLASQLCKTNIKKKLFFSSSLTTALAAIVALGTMSSSHAKVLFTDTSLSVLYGNDYELVEDGELTTITLEHASTHSWGGVFFFVDRHQGANDIENNRFKETYGEFAPKLKLTTFDDSFIKQLNLAGQFTIEIQYSSLFAFQVSAAVFAESVIGGLLFDFFLKKR